MTQSNQKKLWFFLSFTAILFIYEPLLYAHKTGDSFWKKPIFILADIVILILVATVFFRYRVNRLRKREEELEYLVNQRTLQLKNTYKEMEKLSIAASKTDNTVIITDADGNIDWVNEGFTRMYGMNLDEFIAARGRNILEASINPEIANLVSACKREKKSVIYESFIINKTNQKVWYQTTLTPILDSDNHIIHLVAIDSDITRVKQSEEAAEMANRSKGEFLARMSHEIRTPMNAIIGFTDMLLTTDLNEEQFDYTRTIFRSGEALISLLNDILDFSKIEAGELAFDPIDFDPEVAIFDICDLIIPKIGNKPVEISCRIANNVPAFIKSDAGRFRQVALNLMGNAVKFTERGAIEISLEVEEKQNDQLKLHTCVRDTGIGIPKDKLEVVFNVFQQADGSITRKYGGTGLGLAICRQIARMMGGNVWAESEPGKGSIFHFTAWVGKSEKNDSRNVNRIKFEGRKILMVDDNFNSLEIVKRMLEFSKMRVVTTRSLEDMIPVLQEHFNANDPFEICIIDIDIAGSSGYEAAKKLRKLKSLLSFLPLLAFTSSTMNRSHKFKEAGFDGFLLKPIQRKRLLKMMGQLLEKKAPAKRSRSKELLTQSSLAEEPKKFIHILLAEDNAINQKLILYMLAKAGYQTTMVNNGQEVVDAFLADPDKYDLILMDIQMPGMDGREATRRIRSEGFDDIPIVALTAESMKGDREKCIDAGMNDYISKPVRREDVFHMVKKWVFEK
ncbi:MAG: response regulator [Candidatus Omnitrophota bacterium]